MTTRRTTAEQREWDHLYRRLVVECVRQEGFQRAMGCLHMCRDIADQALVERRQSIKGEKP